MGTIADGHWHRLEGMRILRSHLNVELWTITNAGLRTRIEAVTGVTGGNAQLWDSDYFLVPLTQWRRIIQALTNTNTLPWVANRQDCDNFASLPHAKVCELFRLNALASVLGRVWRVSDGVLVGHHMWNAFFTSTSEIYYVEPQTDSDVLVTTPEVVMGSWRYRADRMFWF